MKRASPCVPSGRSTLREKCWTGCTGTPQALQALVHRVSFRQREDEAVETGRKTGEVRPRAIPGTYEFEKIAAEHGKLIARPEAVITPLGHVKTKRAVLPCRFVKLLADINDDMVKRRNGHCFLSCDVEAGTK